jgi:hypothetical protein
MYFKLFNDKGNCSYYVKRIDTKRFFRIFTSWVKLNVIMRLLSLLLAFLTCYCLFKM